MYVQNARSKQYNVNTQYTFLGKQVNHTDLLIL